MKKRLIMSTALALLAILMIGTTSCKKEEIEVPAITDPAQKIAGDYIGSGTDANGTPFMFQVIRISKISNKRVRVESIGHNFIALFEINVEAFESSVASVNDPNNNSLAVQFDQQPFSIALSGSMEESFAGNKQ